MSRVAIFLYDVTGFMAQPWLESGYECWLFDGQHPSGITRDGNLVKVGMWFEPHLVHRHAAEIAKMVGGKAEFVFGFPECTQLTCAGAKHFKKKALLNPHFQQDALSLCMLVPEVARECGTDCWAFENPVGVISTMWRKPDFMFNPADYGGYLPMDDEHPLYPHIYPPRDAYNKGTCIWNGPGFKRPELNRIEPLHKANPGWAKCGGKSLQTKNIRSATPRGFTIATHVANARPPVVNVA